MFSPTDEQVAILEAFRTGGDMVVEAGAGTGKSTVLRMLAESGPHVRFQYTAFNKAIVTEATERMPANTTCNTVHSLAFRSAGTPFARRLNSARMPGRELARRLGVTGLKIGEKWLSDAYLAGLATRGAVRFCQTADPEPSEHHIPYVDGIDEPENGKRGWRHNRQLRAYLAPFMARVWEDATNVNGELPYRHDFYVKLAQLRGMHIAADVVAIDEAQDISEVFSSIVDQQRDHAQIVAVGDGNQSIYSYLGALDYLQKLDAQHRLMLSQSFRFGPAIADLANELLAELPTELRLRGLASIPSRIDTVDAPDACLYRTNAGAVGELIRLMEAGVSAHLVGGANDVVSFARAAADLIDGRRTSHQELACFESWFEVQDYVKSDAMGDEIKLLVGLIDRFGPATIIAALERMPGEKVAKVVLSTAHKCVHPDTLVETTMGLLPISAIPDAGTIATPFGPREYGEKVVIPSGPVLTITTKRGYSVTVTPDHGMEVWDGEKHSRVRADEIEEGDWLRLRIGSTVDGDSAVLPPAPSTDIRSKLYTIPGAMTTDLAEFIGLVVADGTIFRRGKGIRLVKRHLSVARRFASLAKSVFGYDATVDERGTPMVEIHSCQIGSWLTAIGGMSPNDKYVPDAILRSPMPIHAAFLRGLWEDGTVNEKDGKVDHLHWDHKGHATAGVVQTMMLRLGIPCTRKDRGHISTVYVYSEHAQRFAETIGFVADEKNARMNGASFSCDHRNLIPITRAELLPLEPSMSVTDKQNARLNGYLSRAVAKKTLAAVGPDVGSVLAERLQWIYEPVQAIKPGESKTMCVTVPDGSRFLQNGFDGWNSKGREWPQVRLGGDFPDDLALMADEEIRLMYVGVTRAKLVLDPRLVGCLSAESMAASRLSRGAMAPLPVAA